MITEQLRAAPENEARRARAEETPPASLRLLHLLAELPPAARRPIDLLPRLRERLGDVYSIDLGSSRFFALNHPRHAQHVLRDRASIYRKGGALWDSIRTLLGNGLIVSEGEIWRRQRRMMQPHFHRERLSALTEEMVGAIQSRLGPFEAAADARAPIDLAPEIASIAMGIIVRTMFGSGLDRRDADRVTQAMGYALDFMLRGALFQHLPRWLPVPGRARYEEAIRTIDRVIYEVIERRKQALRAAPGGDLLAMMLDMVDGETEQRMTDRELRDEAVTMFLAGYETSSTTIAWASHFLADRPEHQAALAKEVDAVLGDRTPTFADLPRLEYARMVLEETLRLHGPVYWLPREALEDDVIDGHVIPRGSTVGVMVYAIHRHPDAWERPEEFDPERFRPARAAARPPGAWMPFGVGQRLCIGRDLAMMEGQILLAMMAQRYTFRPVQGRPTRPYVGTTLTPKGGVWVTLARR
ncbi:MAG: cytochrome P450 [Polyangiaceae bacterium]